MLFLLPTQFWATRNLTCSPYIKLLTCHATNCTVQHFGWSGHRAVQASLSSLPTFSLVHILCRRGKEESIAQGLLEWIYSFQKLPQTKETLMGPDLLGLRWLWTTGGLWSVFVVSCKIIGMMR